ncbi:LemA family protein [Flammeovirga sp. EKP202]|uniref:LemA family protein n=1 Tax=Flammeovirga sp. EKP202 TaxID=2770592 RepID=UPI00165F36D6|nr:LemA family protein [Flammeovirga sp. EKP202]MBD0400463.1 LemA family protein [Flammeovirga sp. EKP202]
MKKIHLTLAALFFLLFACSTEQKQDESEEGYEMKVEDLSKVDSKALYQEIDSLKKEAFASEELKISKAKMIVQILNRSNAKLDKEKKRTAKSAISQASRAKYSKSSFNNNEEVMQYDQRITEMITALNDLIDSVDDLDAQEETEMLLSEVSDANARDTFTRGYYNNAVKKWNKMTKDYKAKLEKENPEIKIAALDYFYGEEPL